MEFIFLGTGAGLPSKNRNVTAIALWLEQRGSFWLFDCGEATQHQIMETKVKLGKIEKIFITHLHGDHIFGLPGLLGSRSFQGSGKALVIYGPPGLKAFIETALATSKTHLTYELSIVEVAEGCVLKEDGFSVICQKLAHGIDSYGYRIEQEDVPGALLAEKLKAAGIVPGPLCAKLKRGEDVLLEDGRLIKSEQFIGAPKPGKILAVLGDTRYCEAAVQLAKGADWLVHEATFKASDAKMAHDYFHSTTVEAATVAKSAGAKNLIMTHISSRYPLEDEALLLKEAAAIFPNSFLAHDLKEFQI